MTTGDIVKPARDPRLAELEPNRFEVSLDAIRHNARELRHLVGPGCALYAALKCNAYGFGLVPVTKALEEAGTNAVAVARVRDAITLREAGVTLPILLYGGAVTTPELVAAVERFELTPTVLDAAAADVYSRHATAEIPVFLKVDVGQRRLGAEPAQLASLAAYVEELAQLRLDGIYTHMTVPADPVPEGHVETQFELFRACLEEVEAAGINVRVRMAASSSVLRLYDGMTFNAVDPGRMYFGTLAEGAATEGLKFRSAVRSVRSRLIQVKELHADERRPRPPAAVSDGMLIGIVALGTADGLGVFSAGEVLIRGHRVPMIEPIPLEHCRVDLTSLPEAEAGDDVVVIGRQDGDEITLEEVAAHRGLGPYVHNIPINVRDSVQRTYVD
jgi:alanine racemase